MAKVLEISDELHAALERRAREEGVPLTQFVSRELEKQTRTMLTPDELLDILKQIPPLDLGNLSIADLIREGHEERADQILDAISDR